MSNVLFIGVVVAVIVLNEDQVIKAAPVRDKSDESEARITILAIVPNPNILRKRIEAATCSGKYILNLYYLPAFCLCGLLSEIIARPQAIFGQAQYQPES